MELFLRCACVDPADKFVDEDDMGINVCFKQSKILVISFVNGVVVINKSVSLIRLVLSAKIIKPNA